MLGQMLGAYRIESELGSGGMGKVYLADAVSRGAVPAGTRVALKVVHPHLLSEPGFFKRFLREAEIGKAVSHPNVVRCYDCDQLVVDGTTHAFLVMEYVEGQTLRGLLDELETVPEELCRHIGREVSKGLEAIHEVGVIHRDLKPENVLITPEHEVKVMDLGVARLADEAIRLSMSGAFVGSVLYAAPEQFQGKEPDGRADLFALGVILYELSSGVHPHPGDDFASVLSKVVEEPPRRLGERNPQLSAFFEEVVHALLEKDREERFASGSKLLEVLEQGERSTWWGSRAKALRAETKRPLRRIRIPRETAVYGREDELAKLQALYEKAKSGDGRVVLIEGEAGIGKTRLVDELVGRLQQSGEDLNFLFGSYPPGGAATASGAWSTAYREQFGAEGAAPWLRAIPALVPAFDALLRGEPPPAGVDILTKASLQQAFIQSSASLARERTTVVLIEDLHFSPTEGRALFAALAPAVPESRILLVGTTRPGLTGDWLSSLDRHENAHRLELDRLGPKDLARLLEDAFRSERLATELGYRIALKSDGNPFFVFEIIRGLREGGLLSRDVDGSWTSTREIRDILIPSSVAELIQSRIAGLSAEEQELLDVAACCGFEFDPEVVAEVVCIAPIQALRSLGRMEKTRRLVRAAGEAFIFDHHQVQETLYAGLSDPLKRRYHAAIGKAMEQQKSASEAEPEGAVAATLCDHFLRGGLGDRARIHLEPAVEHLQKGFQFDQTADLLRRALVAPGVLEGAARVDALLRLDSSLYSLGRIEEKWEVLAEAREVADLLGDPARQARARVAEGDQHETLEQHSEAGAAYEEAAGLAEAAGALVVQASALRALGHIRVTQARPREALQLLDRALSVAREGGNRAVEARVRGNTGLVLVALGRLEEAREHHEADYRMEIDQGAPGAGARAAANLGDLCRRLGDLTGSRKYVTYYAEQVTLKCFRPGQGLARTLLGILHFTLGDLDGAEGHLGAAREILAMVVPGCTWDGLAMYWQGELCAARGEMERAEQHYRDAMEIWDRISDPAAAITAMDSIAVVTRATGRPDVAGQLHRQVLDRSRECGSDLGLVLTSCRLASLGEGEVAAALELLNERGHLLDHTDLMESRYLLWQATGDALHLEEAHGLLCHLRDHAPEEYRETMIENIPLNRDIMVAWEEHQTAS